MGQLIIGGLPGFDNFFITLLLGNKTAAVVLCDMVYSCLSVSDQLRLACRYGHIGNRYGHSCSCRELVTNCLNIIQCNSSLGSAMNIDNFFKDLL